MSIQRLISILSAAGIAGVNLPPVSARTPVKASDAVLAALVAMKDAFTGRAVTEAVYKDAKKKLFAKIKADAGLPSSTKIKLEIRADQPDYGIVKTTDGAVIYVEGGNGAAGSDHAADAIAAVGIALGYTTAPPATKAYVVKAKHNTAKYELDESVVNAITDFDGNLRTDDFSVALRQPGHQLASNEVLIELTDEEFDDLNA